MARLDFELFIKQVDWLFCTGLLLIALAFALELLYTRQLATELTYESQHLARLRQQLSASPPIAAVDEPLIMRRLHAFQSTLGEKPKINEYLEALFAEAAKHAITLSQGQYKLESDRVANCYVYRITLPVRGPYPKVRTFVDATLRTLPAASLEDVDFKRDGIGASITEAKLQFALYLRRPEP